MPAFMATRRTIHEEYTIIHADDITEACMLVADSTLKWKDYTAHKTINVELLDEWDECVEGMELKEKENRG